MGQEGSPPLVLPSQIVENLGITKCLLGLALIVMWSEAPGWADPIMEKPLVRKLADYIVVECALKNSVDEKMLEKLKAGIHIQIEYVAECFSEKTNILEAAVRITYDIAYDAPREEFVINGPRGTTKIKTIDEMDRHVRLRATELVVSSKLGQDRQPYWVRGKAVLQPLKREEINRYVDTAKQQLFLDALFAFVVGMVSPERQETPWVRSDRFTVESLK